MFTIFEPSEIQINKFLAEQRNLLFSYEEVGASKEDIPSNYPINHYRIQLGSGAEVFARGKAAIQSWTMYRLDWTRIFPANTPVTVGETVCVVVNHSFCWSINSCRIVYVLEKTGKIEQYGFAFGTLPGHSEEGEERFTVEWHHQDNSVWYELLAFARPHHILARIGSPVVRLIQKKFAKDSGQAMFKAVGGI